MASNNFQKIAVLPIDDNLQNLIETKLQEGFVIQQMLVVNANMVVLYATPDLEQG